MLRRFRAVPALLALLLAGGCGTLIEGENARLDHWGPLPVVCLGQCSALDQYYYDKQQPAATDNPDTTDQAERTDSAEQQAPRQPAASTMP